MHAYVYVCTSHGNSHEKKKLCTYIIIWFQYTSFTINFATNEVQLEFLLKKTKVLLAIYLTVNAALPITNKREHSTYSVSLGIAKYFKE